MISMLVNKSIKVCSNSKATKINTAYPDMSLKNKSKYLILILWKISQSSSQPIDQWFDWIHENTINNKKNRFARNRTVFEIKRGSILSNFKN